MSLDNVLARILDDTRAEVLSRKLQRPTIASAEERVATAPGPPRSFAGALVRPGMSVIAEFKRRSPSAGEIRAGATVQEIVGAYEAGGAAALSVLTDFPYFGGILEDLTQARAATDLPVLRKDFIVDPYQLYEAHAAGADAVLLIVAALADSELLELHAAAGELDLDVLVEVHDQDELQRALALAPAIVGVNNRDLRDFSVDLGRTLALARDMPDEIIVVSESGIATAAQLQELGRAGISAVLVGESLMRAPDPQLALAQLLGAAP